MQRLLFVPLGLASFQHDVLKVWSHCSSSLHFCPLLNDIPLQLQVQLYLFAGGQLGSVHLSAAETHAAVIMGLQVSKSLFPMYPSSRTAGSCHSSICDFLKEVSIVTAPFYACFLIFCLLTFDFFISFFPFVCVWCTLYTFSLLCGQACIRVCMCMCVESRG